MATRAVIKVKNSNITIYKHWDGGENSTLPWLKQFTIEFISARGNDDAYYIAQLLRSSARDAEKYQLDDSEFTGWGVWVDMEGDNNAGADYIYDVDLDNQTIQVNGKTPIELKDDIKKHYENAMQSRGAQ